MSTIIKAGSTLPSQSGLTVAPLAFNLDDMSNQATDYLEKVRVQAQQILRDAQQQADSIRKQAEAQGVQTAQQHAEKMLDTKLAGQMQTVLPALQKVVQELDQSRQLWLQHWEKQAVQVATQIAEHIIRREIKAQPEITLELIRETLDLATGSADVTLQLNPQDLENMRTQVESIAASLRTAGAIRIVAEPSISQGGCRVETRFGSIDQQIETQLKRIQEEIG